MKNSRSEAFGETTGPRLEEVKPQTKEVVHVYWPGSDPTDLSDELIERRKPRKQVGPS